MKIPCAAYVLFGAMAFATPFAPAAPLSDVPEGVERYARALAAAIKSTAPVSLEAAFESGISAANALKRDRLEQFDEPTYQRVRSLMAGFFITREEVVVGSDGVRQVCRVLPPTDSPRPPLKVNRTVVYSWQRNSI